MTSTPITLFVGTYTRNEGFVDGQGKGIYSITLDPATGQLSPLSLTDNIGTNPSFITATATHLYAVNECDDPASTSKNTDKTGFAVAFKIQSDGTLQELNRQETGGVAPAHIALSPDQKFVSVANYMGGSVALFPVLEDGSLGPMADLQQFSGGCGVNAERQEAPHMHSTTWAPESNALFAADLGNDRVMQFQLDAAAKKLSKNATTEAANRPAGSGPRHMAVHASIPAVYILDELSSTVGVHSYSHGTGSMSSDALQTLSTLPSDFQGSALAADIHISTCGKFLYTSNRFHDSIACFKIQSTGELELMDIESTRGKTPRNFLIYQNLMLVANQDSSDIQVFRIDSDTGKLTFTGHSLQTPTPVCIVPIQQ